MTHWIRHLLVSVALIATLSLVLPQASAQQLQPQAKPGQRRQIVEIAKTLVKTGT